MRKPYVLVNAMLWAAAILAAAVLDAPHVFSLILLPMLAALSPLSPLSHATRTRRIRSDIP